MNNELNLLASRLWHFSWRIVLRTPTRRKFRQPCVLSTVHSRVCYPVAQWSYNQKYTSRNTSPSLIRAQYAMCQFGERTGTRLFWYERFDRKFCFFVLSWLMGGCWNVVRVKIGQNRSKDCSLRPDWDELPIKMDLVRPWVLKLWRHWRGRARW